MEKVGVSRRYLLSCGSEQAVRYEAGHKRNMFVNIPRGFHVLRGQSEPLVHVWLFLCIFFFLENNPYVFNFSLLPSATK